MNLASGTHVEQGELTTNIKYTIDALIKRCDLSMCPSITIPQ